MRRGCGRLLRLFGRSLRGGGGPPAVPDYYFYDTFSTDDAAPITAGRLAEPGPGTWNIESTAHSLSGGDLVFGNAGWDQVDTLVDPLAIDTGHNFALQTRCDASGNVQSYHQLCDTTAKATAVPALGAFVINQASKIVQNNLEFDIDRCAKAGPNIQIQHKMVILGPNAGGAAGGFMYLFDDDGTGARVGFVTRDPFTLARGTPAYLRIGSGVSYPTASAQWVCSKQKNHTQGSGLSAIQNHSMFKHHDPFDGPGANLNGYVPYKGNPWTVVSGSFATDGSGFARGVSPGGGVASIAITEIGRDMDFIISGRIKAADTNTNFGVVFRFIDINNYQRVTYNWSSGMWYYNKVVAGVDTNIAAWLESINDGGAWGPTKVRKFQVKLFTSNWEVGNKMQFWAEHQPDPYHRKTNQHVDLDPSNSGGTAIGLFSIGSSYAYWDEIDVIPIKVSDWEAAPTTIGKITPDEEDGA